MGTTPIIVAIESSAGINDGAVQLCTACLPLIDVYGQVTGFSAVIVGFLFFLFAFFSPLIDSIPANATCPVSDAMRARRMCRVPCFGVELFI